MDRVETQLELFINDQCVGTVLAKGVADSWYFGEFQPNAAFCSVATLFGEWSLLIHADDKDPRLSSAASEELRQVERSIDALRAQMFRPETGEWLEISQLNIDGNQIEWKL